MRQVMKKRAEPGQEGGRSPSEIHRIDFADPVDAAVLAGSDRVLPEKQAAEMGQVVETAEKCDLLDRGDTGPQQISRLAAAQGVDVLQNAASCGLAEHLAQVIPAAIQFRRDIGGAQSRGEFQVDDAFRRFRQLGEFGPGNFRGARFSPLIRRTVSVPSRDHRS